MKVGARTPPTGDIVLFKTRGRIPEAPAAPSATPRGGNLPCSERACTASDAVRCAYVDRRQRRCETAWCHEHHDVVFDGAYCRRHAGVIRALGPDHGMVALPDLENRAPSLANWVGRDLDGPIRELLEEHFPGQRLNASGVVIGGGLRDRTWGRTWKLVSEAGVDVSVGLVVPEADDTVIRLMVEGKMLLEMTPPWIEARRHRIALDAAIDAEARRRFYALLLDDLRRAMEEARERAALW